MGNKYVVGNVTSIEGIKVNVLMNDQSNLETFHYNGIIYDGVSIGSYVGIIRGSNKIIGRVEKEFLKDKNKDPSVQEFSKNRFERYLEIHLIGNIYNKKFEFGIKRFPMIFNEVVLLNEQEIKDIIQNNTIDSKNTFCIGNSVSNNIKVDIPWNKLFNTHIGIFGNTGSGKSNTLAKIYTELFYEIFFKKYKRIKNKYLSRKPGLKNKNKSNIKDEFLFYEKCIKRKIKNSIKSKFIIIDFNGEYVSNDIFIKDKKCLKLSTSNNENNNKNKLLLTHKMFWDIDTLSILYSATEKTQRPFLNQSINVLKETDQTENLIEKLSESFYLIFKNNNNKETLNLLKKSLKIIYGNKNYNNEINSDFLNSLWHSKTNTYYFTPKYDSYTGIISNDGKVYVSKFTDDDINNEKTKFENKLSCIKDKINKLKITDKLLIASYCHLIYCLSDGKVNYEHISPLIKRIENRSKFIENTINVSKGKKTDKDKDNFLEIISLRDCNSDAKKMLPLLIAKQLYEEHKKQIKDQSEITSTVHLIIDEAHNILSEQSKREEEFWKDYRLEVFEEIIKEGRKFGFFITLASQRPCDISATIVSQLHNYFIHRLVNEQDLRMIANTINSLDSVSKNRIQF